MPHNFITQGYKNGSIFRSIKCLGGRHFFKKDLAVSCCSISHETFVNSFIKINKIITRKTALKEKAFENIDLYMDFWKPLVIPLLLQIFGILR